MSPSFRIGPDQTTPLVQALRRGSDLLQLLTQDSGLQLDLRVWGQLGAPPGIVTLAVLRSWQSDGQRGGLSLQTAVLAVGESKGNWDASK